MRRALGGLGDLKDEVRGYDVDHGITIGEAAYGLRTRDTIDLRGLACDPAGGPPVSPYRDALLRTVIPLALSKLSMPPSRSDKMLPWEWSSVATLWLTWCPRTQQTTTSAPRGRSVSQSYSSPESRQVAVAITRLAWS